MRLFRLRPQDQTLVVATLRRNNSRKKSLEWFFVSPVAYRAVRLGIQYVKRVLVAGDQTQKSFPTSPGGLAPFPLLLRSSRGPPSRGQPHPARPCFLRGWRTLSRDCPHLSRNL